MSRGSNRSEPPSLQGRQVAFYDSAPPAVPAGDYELALEQEIELPAVYAPPTPYTLKHQFTVAGPQLGLGPADVVTTFPPGGSQADWSTVLPHVVLARPTLPWEVPTGAGKAPWLALLLLSVDEGSEEIILPGAPEPGNATFTQTVPLAEYLSPPPGTAGPVLHPKQRERLLAENPKRSCVVVDVAAAAFDAVAPRLSELPYLVHMREAAGGEEDELGIGAGDFSVVIGNRLPGKSGGRFAAHLVSLLGSTGYLPVEGGTPQPFKAIRLLSLASWAFQSLPEQADFLYLMEKLERGMLEMPAPQGSPVGEALAKGYVGLPYGTRTGEQTTAWYRGPCHPEQMERNPQPLYEAADAALVYDPETGMFDSSFAVAWQLGRLLALANRKFALSFLGWVRDHLDRAYLLAERMALFQGAGSAADSPAPSELLEPGFVRRAATRLLARRLAPAPEGSLLEPLAPPRDPTGLQDRLHKVPGVLPEDELETAIAAGGDPHEAIRRRAEEGP